MGRGFNLLSLFSQYPTFILVSLRSHIIDALICIIKGGHHSYSTFFSLAGCCIYEKARKFGDSSSSESDSDDEGCSHNAYCSGHKSDKHHDHDQSKGDPSNPQDTSS